MADAFNIIYLLIKRFIQLLKGIQCLMCFPELKSFVSLLWTVPPDCSSGFSDTVESPVKWINFALALGFFPEFLSAPSHGKAGLGCVEQCTSGDLLNSLLKARSEVGRKSQLLLYRLHLEVSLVPWRLLSRKQVQTSCHFSVSDRCVL